MLLLVYNLVPFYSISVPCQLPKEVIEVPYVLRTQPVSLDMYIPGDNYDPRVDLVEVKCGDDCLYVVLNPPVGGWVIDSSHVPIELAETVSAMQSLMHGQTFLLRVLDATVGDCVRIGYVGHPRTTVWVSNSTVTRIQPVHRGIIRPTGDFKLSRVANTMPAR